MKIDGELLNSEIDALARLDFHVFATEVWKVLYGSKPLHALPYLACLAWHLQEFAEGRCRRLIVCIAPRMLKSYLASVALPAWMLGHDPTLRIGTFSYGDQLVEQHSKECQALMQSEAYQGIFVNTVLGGKQAAHQFNTTANGYRRAISVGGQSTGFGANRIIIDDPIKAIDASSEHARDENFSWLQNSVLTRLDNQATDGVLLVMQRMHPDDLAGRLIAQGGWDVLQFPLMAEQRIEYGFDDETFVMNKGDLLDPIRHPESTLTELRRSVGSAVFEAQYQQNPLQGLGGILHWDWFRTYCKTPDNFSQIVQSWDVACSLAPTAAYSVCTTWGIAGHDAYLLDVYRRRREMPDLLRDAVQLDEKWRPNLIIAEISGIGRPFAQELRDRGYDHVLTCEPKEDKVTRAHGVAPIIERGRIWVPEMSPWLQDFKNEIKAFDMGGYDDQVDSLTQFVKNLDWLIQRPHPRSRPHGQRGPWRLTSRVIFLEGLFQ